MTLIKFLEGVLIQKYLWKTIKDDSGEPFIVRHVTLGEAYDGMECDLWDRIPDWGPPDYKVPKDLKHFHLYSLEELPEIIQEGKSNA